MTVAERYQKMATELRKKARKEQSAHVKSEFESLAECYTLLAKRPLVLMGTTAKEEVAASP
jgi:hypothetical protein